MSDVLDDAKVYSSHSNKKTIDTEDVQLAVQCRMDHSFTTPPPRDVCTNENNAHNLDITTCTYKYIKIELLNQGLTVYV